MSALRQEAYRRVGVFVNVDAFRKMLTKAIGRTEKHIASTEKAIKFVERWTPPPPKKRSILELALENNEMISWTVASDETVAGAWNDFLKWYHGKPKSRCYVMQHEHGRTMIRRKDIMRYEVRHWEA